MARAATPLDAVDTVRWVRQAAILLLSAGGGNPDVIGSFKLLAAAEPGKLTVLCGRSESPLMARAQSISFVDAFAFESPARKDGFLATNSLLTFAVVLARSFAKAWAVNLKLPDTLDDLLAASQGPMRGTRELSQRCAPLWARPTLVVLFGPETATAAIDLESKFTEAALGVMQMADFRNFAHGRHHWLAKHGETSAVLALASSRERPLAERTLALLPHSVPSTLLSVHGSGVVAVLASLVTAFHIAGIAGAARGIDPGRPRVPSFGRKIYNLHTFQGWVPRRASLSPVQSASIERKAGIAIEALRERGELGYWLAAYRRFVKRLWSASFSAVVLDYDGTLCETRDRRKGLRAEVATELSRLARSGLTICVVTGRGQSVRTDLQRELPADLWSRIVVGYYNGSDIALLADGTRPSAGMPHDGLRPIYRALVKSDGTHLYEAEGRPSQVSVVPKPGVSYNLVWDVLQRATLLAPPGASVVRSGHSFDVLAPGVSKSSIVTWLATDAEAVLRIGDRGRWPGNDFALLSTGYSLSAHEVSSDPVTCWNLAPPGQRGVSATLFYLRSLRVAKGRHAKIRLAGHHGRSRS